MERSTFEILPLPPDEILATFATFERRMLDIALCALRISPEQLRFAPYPSRDRRVNETEFG